MKKKKRSGIGRFFSILGKFLLILLLLAIALPVYLYFAMRSMKVEPMDLKAACEAEPMPVEQRFSAADGELTVRYSLGEIVRKYTKDALPPEEVEETVIGTVAGVIGTEPEAVGLRFEPEGIFLDGAAELGPVRVAGSMVLQPEVRDGKTFLRLEGVRVGLLRLRVETARKIADLFGYGDLLDPEELVFPLDLESSPLLGELTGMSVEKDCLCMTGPWETDSLLLLRPSKSQNGVISWYSDDYRDVIDASDRLCAGDADGAAALLDALSRGEKTVEDIYRSMLTVLGGSGRGEITRRLKYELSFLFPGLDPEQAAEEHVLLEKVCEERDALMRKLFVNAFNAQKKRRITVSGGRFLLDGKEFSPEKLLPELAEQDWLQEDAVELCVNAMPGADVRGISPIGSMIDSADSMSTTVFGDLCYPVGILVRTVNGSHLLYYQTYGKTERSGWQMAERTEPVPADVYERIHQEGKATCVQNW